jgi:hypothetical protein
MDRKPSLTAPETPLAPEDFYFDGANLVFTAAYHRKRGSCCSSGCRHCPYGFEAAGAPDLSAEAPLSLVVDPAD